MTGYYQKYFEGYEEQRVQNKKGKGTHIEYTYVELYYRLNLPVTAIIALRITYIVLFVCTAMLFLHSAVYSEQLNTLPYVVVCQGLNIIAGIWVVWVLIFYVTAPRNMTAYKYKSTSPQLKKSSGICGILLAVEMVALMIGCLFTDGSAIQDSVVTILDVGAGAVFMFAIHWIERNMIYCKVAA